MEILGYIALFFVGITLGTLGGGGSILSVPILVYLFAIDTVLATAYSLFIVGSSSLIGVLLKYNQHNVNIRTGIIFGIPSLAAVFLTRTRVIPAIPDILFQTELFQLNKRAFILSLFALLMVGASVILIAKKRMLNRKSKQPHPIYLIISGLITGLLTGLVGAGGGFLIVPALVYLTNLPFKVSVGTTLLIITINSFVGFTGDLTYQAVHWKFLLSITLLAIVGIFVGTITARSLPTQKLQKSFGWLILMMGAWILLREL
ncbi:sulfite exporter TauE/SafE family protein [Catalinimonas niigatensis]|uniref:sulfite exporter TauE/SafE family protein n=1 Tax=Catalinimonas niigatensis TaxID=1397264 RepID=UPI0026660430|nr:sulfite exporter TauE/SafE family protein [Catalinimonas niigatensis]WPP50748.1 sulfite exporter TauE/SafE family protein [Catalinimonas niigatensis]